MLSSGTDPESYITECTLLYEDKHAKSTDPPPEIRGRRAPVADEWDLIRTSINDKYSGSTKITSLLDHISYCKRASGSNWPNRCTGRVFITNTRRNFIRTSIPEECDFPQRIGAVPSGFRLTAPIPRAGIVFLRNTRRDFNSDIDIKLLFSKVDYPETHATFGVFCFCCTSKVASLQKNQL